MLATPGRLPPDDAAWAYEFKWDGYRALAFHDARGMRLRTRADNDITGEYPELARLAQALPARAILDGEIVALDAAGKPSFHALQNRQRRPRAPIVYMIFDLLHLGDRSLMALTYTERRERLLALGLSGDAWLVPPHRIGGGARMLAAARRQGLEGIIAKRADSRYVPGKRTGAWIKIKLTLREEFVVGGYLHGSGAFAGSLGSLLLGYHERSTARRLLYAGKVGTGFSLETRESLTRALDGMRRATSPFAVPVPRFPVPTVFCEPRLIAEVAFTEWTPDGMVRHPSFQGLRTDKTAEEVEDPRTG
jgi:bifunctional non-homologous end joining protein LigD